MGPCWHASRTALAIASAWARLRAARASASARFASAVPGEGFWAVGGLSRFGLGFRNLPSETDTAPPAPPTAAAPAAAVPAAAAPAADAPEGPTPPDAP